MGKRQEKTLKSLGGIEGKWQAVRKQQKEKKRQEKD